MIGFIPTPQDESMRILASATITASADSNVFDMGVGFNPGGPGMPIAGVLNATAVDRTTGDETYVIKLQESADGSTNWSDITVTNSFTTVGVKCVIGFVNKRYVKMVRTLGGTTPSLTCEAWLNSNVLEFANRRALNNIERQEAYL